RVHEAECLRRAPSRWRLQGRLACPRTTGGSVMASVPRIPDALEVDGARLLDELRAAVTRYVVLPSTHATVAVTLWIAATHAAPALYHFPRLAIRSPEKRCGKTRLLDLVSALCRLP